MPPKTEGIAESSLYVADVDRSVQFYARIFGLRVISDFEGRGCAMQTGNRQVLLLFKKEGSRTIQSPHGGYGDFHLAFAIPATTLTTWEAWLAENGIAVEEKRTWELGGQSLCFRDPDRNLPEVATLGVWSIHRCDSCSPSGDRPHSDRNGSVALRGTHLPVVMISCELVA